MIDLNPLIAALIAFAGTALGIFFGYRKWKKDRDSSRFGQFEKDTQATYKALWDQIEEFNIQVRIEDVTTEQFTEHLKKLNSFMLKGGIYLEDDDRALANNYTRAVFDFQNVVKKSEMDEASIPLGATQDIPQEAINNAKEISEAQEMALRLRSEIRDRVRSVLSGKS